jgi:hypothetical protein
MSLLSDNLMMGRNNTTAVPQDALERSFLVVNDERIESTPDPLEEIKKILGKPNYGT